MAKMTPQEAIELINKIAFSVKNENEEIKASKFITALKMSKQALEKQTPQKPVKKNPICYSKTKDGQELYAYDYHCPMCDTKLKTNDHHCKCGQALDWSDAK